MVVKESFSNISLNANTQAPIAGGWNFPEPGGGPVGDFVGMTIYTGSGPSPLPNNFAALAGQGVTLTQTFTVTTDTAVTTLTTVNTLQVSVDANGNVTGNRTNVVP